LLSTGCLEADQPDQHMTALLSSVSAPQRDTGMSTLSYVIGNSLYLNITDRCTLACTFCPKHNGTRMVHDYDLTLDHRPETDEILASIDDPRRFDQVVFCGYGEPTLRLKTLITVASDIRRRGGRVRVNTDGLANLVHRRNVLPELAACVDALSISMNAQDERVYDRHCQPALPGSYEAMLDFVALAPRYIPDVTASAIDGLDEVDIAACRRLAEERGVKFRRRLLDIVG
jgi:TatD family-associated radical SAM protein